MNGLVKELNEKAPFVYSDDLKEYYIKVIVCIHDDRYKDFYGGMSHYSQVKFYGDCLSDCGKFTELLANSGHYLACEDIIIHKVLDADKLENIYSLPDYESSEHSALPALYDMYTGDLLTPEVSKFQHIVKRWFSK